MSVSLTTVSQTVHMWNVLFVYSSSASFVFISYSMIIVGTATNAFSKDLGTEPVGFRSERNR
jgi:hypothetical protein